MDSCTFYHLCNHLQRSAVTKKIKSDPTCLEQFFLLVTTGHVLHAVICAFGMSSLEDTPSDACFSEFCAKSEQECKQIFGKISEVIDKHFNFKNYSDEQEVSVNSNDCNLKTLSNDLILSYANEVFSLGLFLMEYIDAIKRQNS